MFFFFFKQKTAYEMRISDWSSDVCSSDLLGVYFEQRYGLGPVGIGVALLGFGIPGFLFGPLIGRAADRWGRARLLHIGLGLGALGAATLIFNGPLILAVVAVTVLSLGYDMTQPDRKSVV